MLWTFIARSDVGRPSLILQVGASGPVLAQRLVYFT
jgi:hypothetical protein